MLPAAVISAIAIVWIVLYCKLLLQCRALRGYGWVCCVDNQFIFVVCDVSMQVHWFWLIEEYAASTSWTR